MGIRVANLVDGYPPVNHILLLHVHNAWTYSKTFFQGEEEKPSVFLIFSHFKI